MDRIECPCCGEHLTAPTWSEYVSTTQMRQLWCCAKCGHGFETVDQVDPMKMPAALVEQFLPSLLVA